MKKAKKTAIATLTAAMLTMSALGLAACQKKDAVTPDGPATHTVTFKVNGGAWNQEGTSLDDKTITTDTEGKIAQADFPANPHRADHTFGGWYANDEGTGTAYTFASVFTSDTTLYAKWNSSSVVPPPDDTTYTITLNAHGGTVAGGQTSLTTGTDGKLATLPAATQTGYTFDGWFTAATGGTQVTTATVFDSNTTIHAQWTEDEAPTLGYTIMLDACGGTVAGSSIIKTDANGKLANLPTPTRDDYTFDGWFTAATGGTQVTTATLFGENTTIYAHWTFSGVVTKDQGLYLGDEKKGDFTKIDAENKQAWAYNIDLTTAGSELEIWYNDALVTDVELDEYSTDKVTLTDDFKLKISDTADLSKSIINVLYKYELNEIYVQEVIRADIQADDGIYIGAGKVGSLTQNVAKQEVMATGVAVPAGGATALTIKLGGAAVPITNFGKGEHVKATLAADKKTITIAAGTYDFYYSYTTEAGENFQKLWIAGTSTENLPGGDVDPPVVEENAYYKIGEDGADVLIGAPDKLSQQDIDDGIEVQYSIKGKQFELGNKLYFTVGTEAKSFTVSAASTGIIKPAAATDYIEISKAGKFDIYLKYQNSKWQLYASRAVDPSEITKPADTVEANGAYLVGAVDGSDAGWDNSNTKGFALTKQADSELYELTIELTAGDNFKFYKTGATTATKTWVGAVATENIEEFMTSGNNTNANITVNASGKFKFVVDFTRKSVYVSYSADGEPTDPEVPQTVVNMRGDYNGTTDWANGWKMESVALTDGAVEKYQIEVTVEAGKSLVFKVVYDGEWINVVHGNSPVTPGWQGDNLKLSEGSYVISLLVWNVQEKDWKIYIENKA